MTDRGPSLACPRCRTALGTGASVLACSRCGTGYPIVDGIPSLVLDQQAVARDELAHLVGADHDHDERSGPDEHKAAQTAHFDREIAAEFEITRPDGTPRLYQYLLNEKFVRATAPIASAVQGLDVLVVCGGSGMDATFLARAGARVVSSDLSIGASRRSAERARRLGLPFTSIVADIERLPFEDRSFDLVYVHDGLHHLEHPELGLAEMARVARRWVSVTEPARATATAIAIRLGLALAREDAGNVVRRLAPSDVVALLRSHGYRPLVATRYAMYYRHQPGPVFRALSHPAVFPIVRTGWRWADAAFGAATGNKLVVVAERNRD